MVRLRLDRMLAGAAQLEGKRLIARRALHTIEIPRNKKDRLQKIKFCGLHRCINAAFRESLAEKAGRAKRRR
jgi:hypothetical protein